ncbi:hypothetical protein EDD17DRAFT_907086 [Pisolithus thermaeus]|nr:hypothetical protein EDD17DRAFT_907086 [Pisolithus thermaeus]
MRLKTDAARRRKILSRNSMRSLWSRKLPRALPPRAAGQVIVFLQAAERQLRISLAQDIDIIGMKIQLKLKRSTACTPTNVNAEFPTQPPPEPKRRNKVDLVSFPTFRRIRRLLTPSGDHPEGRLDCTCTVCRDSSGCPNRASKSTNKSFFLFS